MNRETGELSIVEGGRTQDLQGVRSYPHPYLCEEHGIREWGRIDELLEALGYTFERSVFGGFGGSNCYPIMTAIYNMVGVPWEEEPCTWNEKGWREDYLFGKCHACSGSGRDPTMDEEAYEEWSEYEPPEGTGYQLWETVSEGSPVSPVMPTAEAMIEWMVENGDGNYPVSREAAEKFVLGSGWAPSMVAVGGKLTTGVEASTILDKDS